MCALNGREATASFPELTAALADTAADRRFVIDGEVIAPEMPTGILILSCQVSCPVGG